MNIVEQIKNSLELGGMEGKKALPGKFDNTEISAFIQTLPASALVIENNEVKSDFETTRDAQMYARQNHLVYAKYDGMLMIRQF